MFGFLKSKRPVRSGPKLRSFLRMEELGDRAMPSDLLGTTPPEPPPPPPAIENPLPGNPPPVNPPPAQVAPFINTFIAAEAAHGWWTLSGHVNGNNVSGLIVRFDGVPGVENATATVDANGNFTVTIPVATDGSDRGTISAQTTQNGVDSNLAFTFMNPTP